MAAAGAGGHAHVSARRRHSCQRGALLYNIFHRTYNSEKPGNPGKLREFFLILENSGKTHRILNILREFFKV